MDCAAKARPRALLAERRLPRYRVAFLEAARVWLQQHGVQFDFMHGQATPAERARDDAGELDWALCMPEARTAWGGKAVWQPFATQDHDLVIVSHENGLLFNHWLCRPWRHFRLGFFGHGANLAASSRDSWRERFKRVTTRQADWWFAYTSLSQRLVLEAGFPAGRITVVNNATDTDGLRQQIAATAPQRLQLLRQAHRLTAGHTALFLGSMVRGKGLDRLIDAAARVQRQDPTFVLLMVGDGDARQAAEQATRGQSHIRWLGAQWGADKAALMAVSDCLCMPGAVGLAIVDAFAAGLPLLTTDAHGHGPEIAYLDPGRNGAITGADAGAFAAGLLSLLQDPVRLRRWREQAAADGRRYTVQAMAERFGQGVLDALARPRL